MINSICSFLLRSHLIRCWVLTVAAALPVPGNALPIPFINEIHYDNANSDVSEGVEVAGKAGLDLTGWGLYLYNGSNGRVYDSLDLSGVMPNLINGYGVLAFFLAGMQNGSPDGVALVDAMDSVIQFLSYEGSLLATNGPANGMTSTDIGVVEASSTPAGFSLQLLGSGTSYEDFTWSGPVNSSFGLINDGQTFVSETSGDPGPSGFVPEPSISLLLLIGVVGGALFRFWRFPPTERSEGESVGNSMA